MDSVNNNGNGVATEEARPQMERPAEPVEPEAAVRTEVSSAELTGERDRLAREKGELQDLLQRRQAEFENFRRRVEKEKNDLFEYAAMDSVKALVPILDDFDRAIKVETADKEYARGMEMIHKRFYEALRKLGLEPLANESGLFN